MIHIKELRIGNIVVIDDLVQSVRAICLNTDEQSADPSVGYMMEGAIHYTASNQDGLQGMPITNEVLERSGFQFDSYFKLWQKMKPIEGTGVDMELDRDYTALDFSHHPILKGIKHLHHLQNLYYALKQKELPVNITLNQKIPSNNINAF